MCVPSALSAWGAGGKLAVEVAMVAFLVGIGVSFHVVMGDLLPGIVALRLGVLPTDGLRCVLLLGWCCLFCCFRRIQFKFI